MNKDYQQAIALLDSLSPEELVALMGKIASHLQQHVGEPVMDSDEEVTESGRRYLPRLPQMIQWGLVVPMEDKLYLRDAPNQPALLLDASRVAYQGETLSINDWAKHITGWKSVNVYEWVVVERTNTTLDDLRRDYMIENDL